MADLDAVSVGDNRASEISATEARDVRALEQAALACDRNGCQTKRLALRLVHFDGDRHVVLWLEIFAPDAYL